jgi:hypothetical protein
VILLVDIESCISDHSRPFDSPLEITGG